MSLINDALKKAQKQRTGESPPLAAMPAIGGETPARIARRAKPVGFNALLIRVGVGAAALIVVAGGAWFLLGNKPEEKPVTQPSIVSSQPSAQTTAPSAPIAAPSSALPAPTSSPAPSFTVQTAPKVEVMPKVEAPAPTSSVSTPQVSGLRSQVSTAVQPAAASSELPAPRSLRPDPQVSGLRSQVSEPAKPALPPKLDSRAINYIENIKVVGIRASASDAKVLMNDRVYRVGDTVEHELGLKLTGITANSLTFENEQGARYVRTF